MKCKNCNQKKAVKYSKYSNGEFCCRECSRTFSTKDKRAEINEKVSKKLLGRIVSNEIIKKITGKKNGAYKNGKYCNKKKLQVEIRERDGKVKHICKECKKEFLVKWIKRRQVFCSRKCVQKSEVVKKKLSISLTKACSSTEAKKRLRDIGRKGGFGKKGYTKKGIYFQSNLEKNCFELLENKNIFFEPHRNIPNSSKVSDLYIPKINIWIELDGINREKRKKWLGKNYEYWLEKIEIYKRENLKLIIIKTEKEFLSFLKEYKL